MRAILVLLILLLPLPLAAGQAHCVNLIRYNKAEQVDAYPFVGDMTGVAVTVGPNPVFEEGQLVGVIVVVEDCRQQIHEGP